MTEKDENGTQQMTADGVLIAVAAPAEHIQRDGTDRASFHRKDIVGPNRCRYKLIHMKSTV